MEREYSGGSRISERGGAVHPSRGVWGHAPPEKL